MGVSKSKIEKYYGQNLYKNISLCSYSLGQVLEDIVLACSIRGGRLFDEVQRKRYGFFFAEVRAKPFSQLRHYFLRIFTFKALERTLLAGDFNDCQKGIAVGLQSKESATEQGHKLGEQGRSETTHNLEHLFC